MRPAHVEFDASNDHIRIDLVSEEARTDNVGIAIDGRTTSAGQRWSDTDWHARVDLHLQWADHLAVLLGTGVRYDQLWCEVRAKKIGAHHPDPRPSGADEDFAERQERDRIYGANGPGRPCVLIGCNDPYHATYEDGGSALDLCISHFDQVAR